MVKTTVDFYLVFCFVFNCKLKFSLSTHFIVYTYYAGMTRFNRSAAGLFTIRECSVAIMSVASVSITLTIHALLK